MASGLGAYKKIPATLSGDGFSAPSRLAPLFQVGAFDKN